MGFASSTSGWVQRDPGARAHWLISVRMSSRSRPSSIPIGGVAVDRRPAYVDSQMYEKTRRFCIMNRNKRGITLDLTQPQGLTFAKRLLARAHVVINNFSIGVLPKFGFC